jgi:soluble lytic murein transglycosylase
MIKQFFCSIAILFCTLCCQAHQGTLTEEKCTPLLKSAFMKGLFPSFVPQSCPLTNKLIEWKKLQNPKYKADSEVLKKFIQESPSWPHLRALKLRIETILSESTNTDSCWFDTYAPVSLTGTICYIESLFQAGKDQQAIRLIQEAWQSQKMMPAYQKSFYNKFYKYLTYQDHKQRLKYLMWEEDKVAVKSLVSLGVLKTEDNALGEAFQAVIEKSGSSDKFCKKLSQGHLKEPIVFYYRIKGLLHKDHHEKAFMTFKEALNAHCDQENPSKWFGLRLKLVRKALKDKKYAEAYDLIRYHYLDNGPEAAEAEWLSGWISLKFLKQASRGLQHFQRFYIQVQTPISQAKAAYWMGLTYDKLGNLAEAKKWYRRGAVYPTTFYGQLSLQKCQGAIEVRLTQKQQVITVDQKHSWYELIQGIKLLAKAGLKEDVKIFIIHLAKSAETREQRETVVALASLYAPELTVLTAKIAAKKGNILLENAYPCLLKLKGAPINIALLHAVIRQESGFDSKAMSPAGAHGLMQLLPKTAEEIAKKIKSRFTRQLLLSHPDLNIKLGSTYLNALLDSFNGNIVLALASYNAGKTRVLKWIQEYGDPRHPHIDILDWIESIPYEETRSYIYRILEAVPIYQKLLKLQK